MVASHRFRQSKRPKSVCSLAVGGAIVSAWTIRTLDAVRTKFCDGIVNTEQQSPEALGLMAIYTIPDRNSQLAPKFWRNETSGQLEFAVRAYLDNPQTMTPNEIAYMRAYLGQWIASPVWDMNPAHTPRRHMPRSWLCAATSAGS